MIIGSSLAAGMPFKDVPKDAWFAAYVQQAANALKHGGTMIVGTFGPEGPDKCSGLEVIRYDARSLQDELGPQFQLLDSIIEVHDTPFGATQQFLYCCCRMS